MQETRQLTNEQLDLIKTEIHVALVRSACTAIKYVAQGRVARLDLMQRHNITEWQAQRLLADMAGQLIDQLV